MMPTARESESYILFELAGATYGVRSRDVLHMEMLEQITPVPNAPPFIDGVVFSRGQVIPAMNLRRRFGFAPESNTLRTRLLVVQAGERTVGFIVDSAREFRTIPAASIQSPEGAMGGEEGHFLSGIANLGDRLVLLLDVKGMLESAEAQAPAIAEPARPS